MIQFNNNIGVYPLVILFFFFTLIGCKSHNGVEKSDPITFITKECFGKCPTYIFKISTTENATFTGIKNVNKIGHLNIELPQKTVTEIYNQYQELESKTKNYNLSLRDFPEKLLIHHNDTIRLKSTRNIPDPLNLLIKKIEVTVNSYVLNTQS